MTKKEIDWLADIIRANARTGDKATLANLVECLAQFCAIRNDRFDTERFLDACGMPNGEWTI
jgi:hypothetical protein